MSIALLFMTDGRDDLLARTIESAESMLEGNITYVAIHTDNGPEHVAQLDRRYPDYDIIGGPRLGFGGAINRAWGVLKHANEDFILHCEDDFLFNRGVNLNHMADVLTKFPNIVQLALRRQPWNEAEKAAGGIVEMWPDEYTDVVWPASIGVEHQWLEHRLFFTTNPSLYRRALCRTGWPTGKHSEREFSDALFSDPKLVSAFWGSRDSGERVTHIGTDRVGTIY